MATTYKVTYHANGGDTSSVPAAQTKVQGTALTLRVASPTRSGCGFFGWDTEPDGTGTHYDPGDTYTTDAPLDLYAMWLGVALPTLDVTRTNAQGTEADEGAYGTLRAGWSAVGTLASDIRVTAVNVTTSSAITLSGNTTGTLAPGQTASGSVSATFGGSLSADTRYTIRVTVEANTTAPYDGQTRTMASYFEAYVDMAYITIDCLAGGHGVAFGHPAESEGFHCYMPATFHDELNTWKKGTNITTSSSTTTLPSDGTYLIATMHDSHAGYSGIWLIRTTTNATYRLAGGADLDRFVVSGRSVTARLPYPTTGSSTANLYYQKLG